MKGSVTSIFVSVWGAGVRQSDACGDDILRRSDTRLFKEQTHKINSNQLHHGESRKHQYRRWPFHLQLQRFDAVPTALC